MQKHSRTLIVLSLTLVAASSAEAGLGKNLARRAVIGTAAACIACGPIADARELAPRGSSRGSVTWTGQSLDRAIHDAQNMLNGKDLSKKQKKALEEFIEAASAARDSRSAEDLQKAAELAQAIDNQDLKDFPEFVGVLGGIGTLYQAKFKTTLRMSESVKPGLARADLTVEGSPMNSGGANQLKKTPAIASAKNPVVTYDGPAKNGAQLKFKAKYKGEEITVKWAETSESAAADLAAKAGVNVPTHVFTVDNVSVDYTRDAIQNFSKRGTEKFKAGINLLIVKIPLINRDAYPEKNPFGSRSKTENNPYFIAILKDGRQLSGEQLAAFLLHKAPKRGKLPDLSDANFNAANESQIARLYMGKMNVEVKGEAPGTEIGPWSPGQRGHDDQVGFQATTVVMAALGNYDMKVTNNATYVGKDGELKYVVDDMGGSFAVRTSALLGKEEAYEELPWSFVRAGRDRILFNSDFRFAKPNPAGQNISDAAIKLAAANLGGMTEASIRSSVAKAKLSPYLSELLSLKIMARRDSLIGSLMQLGVRFEGNAGRFLLPHGSDGAQARLRAMFPREVAAHEARLAALAQAKRDREAQQRAFMRK